MGNILGDIFGTNQANQAQQSQNAATQFSQAAGNNYSTLQNQGQTQLGQYNQSYNPLLAAYASQAGLNIPGLTPTARPAGAVGTGAGGQYALNMAAGNPADGSANQNTARTLQAPGTTSPQQQALATAAANPLYSQMTPAQQAQVSQQIDTINQQKQTYLAQAQQTFDTNGITNPADQQAYMQQLNEQFDAMANNTVTAAANQANATQQQAYGNVFQLLGAEGTQGTGLIGQAASGQQNIAAGQQNTALQEQQAAGQQFNGLLSAIGTAAAGFSPGSTPTPTYGTGTTAPVGGYGAGYDAQGYPILGGSV